MKLFNKFKSILEYIKLMGFKWFIFRVKYEILKKINFFDKVNKSILEEVGSCDKNLFTYEKIELIKSDFKGNDSFIEKADNAMKGKIFAFSNEYFDYSDDGKINWQMNPVSKVKANADLSWNNLPDFGEYGDIKLIWEASRFPQIYFFINAYSIIRDEKYAKFCVSQIIDWIDSNPYPKGVNYKCGQEMSFRLFSWINALEYFGEFISPQEEKKIVQNIYISLLRIDANIDYAAKSVKNNHSISEAAGLFIGGLLFPQFKESQRLVNKGVKYLLTETFYQIYNDGSYIQHSFTYQRLALDVLSFVFLIADKKIFSLPDILIQRHSSMIDFLNSFIQENGLLPNYGSNDGANLFPVDTSDYRDFRTSLDFACSKSIFFDTKKNSSLSMNKKIEFNNGGYYILKNKNIFSFVRCHTYRDRPAHNDMLHLDVWHEGKNIFCDAGTYSYNTDKQFKNNFTGVVGHNTVMINNKNHMQQVLNFGYSNWTEAKKLHFDNNNFVGENYAYQKEFKITHKRVIVLDDDKLTIVDSIKNISHETNIKQIWNTKSLIEKVDKYSLKVDSCIISSTIAYRLEKSYISDYYNSYVMGTRIIFEQDTDKDIEMKTTIQFKDTK